jgi:hypothetical protein
MRPLSFHPSAVFLAVAAGALAFAACSDSTTTPTTRGLVPLAPRFSVTPGTKSLTIVSDAGTQYCPNQATLGVFTTFPASYAPVGSGCVAARDLEADGSLDSYNPGWEQLTGSHWIGFTVNGGPSSDYRPTPGIYVYQETFTLPSNITAPSLSLNVRADNVVAVYLNGHKLGQQQMVDCNDGDFGPCNWTTGGTLTVSDNTAADFNITTNSGLNTLTFLVNDVPTGFPDLNPPPPPGRGGPSPQYGCPFRPPQPTGSHGFSGDQAVQTTAGHVGPAPTGPGHEMSPTPTPDVANPTQDGCENPTGLDFAGTVSWTIPDTPCPAGSFSSFTDGTGLHITYDQFPAPNDNSYGVNAVGWKNGHKFSDLTGSDHAGFELVDDHGVVQLSFNVDYLSADASAPSGYSSLGVNGGDGKMNVGTASGITATTSLAKNLNNINIPGLFNPATHAQLKGSVNVLVNSPPTDAAHTTYVNSDPDLQGWDFHDTYFVDISLAKLQQIGFNANWIVRPNPAALHNSPAKDCPAGPGGIAATTYEVKDKQVKITIANTGSVNVFLEALTLNWPAVNGKLVQIKLDGDVEYNVATVSGPISLTTAQLPSDPNHRKIDHNSSDVYTLIFEKNADTNLGNYTGTVTFSGTTLTVLPH